MRRAAVRACAYVRQVPEDVERQLDVYTPFFFEEESDTHAPSCVSGASRGEQTSRVFRIQGVHGRLRI